MKRRRDRKQRKRDQQQRKQQQDPGQRDRQQRDRQDRDQQQDPGQRDHQDRQQGQDQQAHQDHQVRQGPEQEEQEQASRGLRLWDELGTILLALLIALLVRTFVFQTFYVPSSSMFPSLLIGDHVFVNKFEYGPNLPFSSVRVPGLREPERGEVVVFRLARGPGFYGIRPADQHPDLPTDNFVKRLVGLPGDTIAYRNGRLILNDAPVPMQNTGLTVDSESGRLINDSDHLLDDSKRPLDDSGRSRDVSGRPLNVWVETLGECSHLVLHDPHASRRDMKQITIPEGRYFFMGDNRDNSLDGRRAGTVRLEELVGPVGVNYWSWDWNGRWRDLLKPWVWYDNLANRMRWERMFQRIECLSEDDLRELLPEGVAGADADAGRAQGADAEGPPGASRAE